MATIAIVATVLVHGCASEAVACAQTEYAVEPPSNELATRAATPHASAPFSGSRTAEVTIFANDDLIQSVSYDPGARDITFHSAGRAPGSPGYELTSARFATSYRIHKIASGGQSHTFYVNGHARNGDDVLELWEVAVRSGGHYASRTAAPQPLGTPSAPFGVTPGIVGGVYRAPSGEAVAVERTELFRGSQLGVFRGVAADPEGRCVFAMAGGALYRIEIGPTLIAPVEVITGFSDIAEVAYVAIRQLAATGERTLVLTRPSGIDEVVGGFIDVLRCLAFDPDNDGHFSFPGTVHDEATYSEAGLLERTGWSSNYVESFR